jgi:hypothetical protein
MNCRSNDVMGMSVGVSNVAGHLTLGDRVVRERKRHREFVAMLDRQAREIDRSGIEPWTSSSL